MPTQSLLGHPPPGSPPSALRAWPGGSQGPESTRWRPVGGGFGPSRRPRPPRLGSEQRQGRLLRSFQAQNPPTTGFNALPHGHMAVACRFDMTGLFAGVESVTFRPDFSETSPVLVRYPAPSELHGRLEGLAGIPVDPRPPTRSRPAMIGRLRLPSHREDVGTSPIFTWECPHSPIARAFAISFPNLEGPMDC
jgi:hypothetical protein